MSSKTKFTLIIILTLLPCSVLGQLKLPKLVSDGMILQRNEEVKIWGWDNPGQSVSVIFMGNTYNSETSEWEKWEITLDALPADGPHEMTINGSENITITDILVGDIWVASGQSKMELWMERVSPVYPDEIANSENNFIRQFLVPDEYDFKKERTDLSNGSWQEANPESILNFSAVAYFFAKKLYDEYEIPIGIINASLGGFPAEAWIRENTLKENFPSYYKETIRLKNDALIDSIEKSDQERIQNWYARSIENDAGHQGTKIWHHLDLDTSNWPKMEIPGYWADIKLAYGAEDIVFSGPVFESMTVEGSKTILSFDHVGNGLTTDDGKSPQHVAIASSDSTFVWADAKIEGNKVVVWSDEVENPIAVRYAWADNPEKANLYNEEGLPATPFRTDDWEAKE